MFKLLHFRGSDKILKKKKMVKDVETTLAYIDDVLSGALYKRELFRQALDEMGWISNNGVMNILEGRRYRYKGYKNSVAIEGNFSAYECILEGLFRLQLGYSKGMIETGVLILTAKRSEKSPYGSTENMVREEIAMLEPTISLPVSIALFDLEEPVITDGEGGVDNGVSVQEDDNQEVGKVSKKSRKKKTQSTPA